MFLKKLKKQIKVVASEPIEDDFDAAFAVLKVIEHPTKAEIQAVIERYRHNYLAYRAICALFDNNKELCLTITIDGVLDACDELFRSFITGNFDIVDMQPEEQFDMQSVK